MKTSSAAQSGSGTPFEIAYRHVEPSPDLDRHVLHGVGRLEQIASDLIRLHVTVSRDNARRRTGDLYEVRLRMTFPGGEVSVTRTPPAHAEDETLLVAVDEAFDKARDELIETHQLRRGEVKTHEPVDHGRVTDLFPDYGFIAASDGRIVYFHRNSVLHGRFDALETGSEVRFAEEMGEQGLQASSVTLVGTHHPTP
jgi:cold shock CspA family protein/ribosome-associated translation inhibitor RaiA